MSELRYCFIDKDRQCNNNCKAFREDGKESCKILLFLDKAIPYPPKPRDPFQK